MNYLIVEKSTWGDNLSTLCASLKSSRKDYIALYRKSLNQRRPTLTDVLIAEHDLETLDKATKPAWWSEVQHLVKTHGLTEIKDVVAYGDIHSLGTMAEDIIQSEYCTLIDLEDFRVDAYPNGYSVYSRKF
jgi:hypothetical protein